MLWYGFLFLFVVGTILSNMFDNSTGFATTRLASAIDVDTVVIPVVDGRQFLDDPPESAPYTFVIDGQETVAYWNVVPPRELFFNRLSPQSIEFGALLEQMHETLQRNPTSASYRGFSGRFMTTGRTGASGAVEAEWRRWLTHIDSTGTGLDGYFLQCHDATWRSSNPVSRYSYDTTGNPPAHYCIPSERAGSIPDDPRLRFYSNDSGTGWADLSYDGANPMSGGVCDASAFVDRGTQDPFRESQRSSDLTTVNPGNRCLIAISPDGRNGRGWLDDEPAMKHPQGAVVQSQAVSELERVVKIQVGEINLGPLGKIEYPTLAFGALGKFVIKALSWDYSFLEGSFGSMFKFIFLYPLSAVVVLMLIKVFIDALSRLRSLIPFV